MNNDEVDPIELGASGTYDVSVEVNRGDVRYSLDQIRGEESATLPDVERGDQSRRYRP